MREVYACEDVGVSKSVRVRERMAGPRIVFRAKEVGKEVGRLEMFPRIVR